MTINRVHIVFVFLFGVVVIEKSNADMEAIKACKEEHKLTREQVMQDESEGVKCFAECIMKKTGSMDADGNFNAEKIKEEALKFAKTDAQKAAVEQAVDKCLEQSNASKPSGKCEKSFEAFKCIRKTALGT